MKTDAIKRAISAIAVSAICLTSVPFTAVDLNAYAGAAVGTTLKVSPSHTREKDTTDGYSYEIWQDTTGGNGSMTLGKGGTFNTEWNCQVSKGNFLARRGMDYDRTRKATNCGDIVLNYEADYSASSQGNSRLCVYGWFVDPLVEYYIIEDWVNWRPTAQGGSQTVTIDGAQYEIFQLDHTGPTILGDTRTFKQYFSVRKNKRMAGTITVSDHFKAWEKAGWNIGNLTEVALNVEGWESSGKANVTRLDFSGEPVPTTEPTTLKPVEPDSNGYYFTSSFENGKDNWSGRGDATVSVSTKYASSGSSSLFVSDRGDNWHGAAITLDPAAFQPGGTYAFSTNVLQDSGSAVDMKFTLQYNLDGEAHYDEVASASAESGVWTQLQNTAFEIPSGAEDLVLYVEAPDSLTDFYIDDASGAVKGTSSTAPKTQKFVLGDVNGDGIVNAFDVVLAKQGLVNGVTDAAEKKAIDVDGDGEIGVNDLVLISEFALNKISAFPTPAAQPATEPATQAATEAPKAKYNYNANVQFKEAPGNYFGSCSQEGKVVKESYNGINGQNKLNVYLPYGYDSSKKYNIFYLMHGGGEDENTLFYNNDTQIQHMFDHMIMNGEMEPMIVVTPTFKKCEAGTFYNELRQSVIPFVEGKYSTYANGDTSPASIKASRMHRAYGGFSMGAVSTWAVMQNCLDIVGYYMPLSGDHWQGNGAYGKAKSIADAVDKSGLSKREYFIFAATGSDDIAYPNISPQIDEMKKMSQFEYTSDFSKGNFYFLVANGKTHWWGYVRHYVYDALPSFFHE